MKELRDLKYVTIHDVQPKDTGSEPRHKCCREVQLPQNEDNMTSDDRRIRPESGSDCLMCAIFARQQPRGVVEPRPHTLQLNPASPTAAGRCSSHRMKRISRRASGRCPTVQVVGCAGEYSTTIVSVVSGP